MESPNGCSLLWLFLLSACVVVPGLAPVLAVLAAAIAPTVIFVQQASSSTCKQEQQLTAAAPSCRPTGQETVSTAATTLRPQQGIDSSARSLPQVAKEDPAQLAAERLVSGGATSAPPCAGCCCQGSSSCPWHLPMALSLNLWGQDSFRFTCSSKRVSDTGRGSSFSNTVLDQQYPADAFTFASTVHIGHESLETPTTPGLLRSLSAPAAATAAGPTRPAAEHIPAHSSACVLSFGPHQQQVQDMPAQTAGHLAAAAMSSTASPWDSKAAAAAAAAACPGSLTPTARPDFARAPTAAVAVPELEGFPAAGEEDAVTPTTMPAPQPQQPGSLVLDWQEPFTPPGQLPSQLLSVLQHIWHEDQQCLSTPGSCPAQMHQSYADIAVSCSQPLPSDQYSSQQQEAVCPGPMNPLPFIATTSRHSMCMRRTSGKLSCGGSPLAGSFSSSGFGGGAQPLPSPAESPLARRLSERDGAGFPTSPQLVELLSSGRRLQRGLSLDSTRSISTPGSTRCSLEAQHNHHHQQQHPQSAPWSGLQLRSVAHVLQQRQQQQQEGPLSGHAAPWCRANRLQRRHTFSSSMELSVAADGAAAAHDFAAAAAAAVAAGSCHSSSKPPYRRHMTMTMMRSSSGGSSCSGTDVMASPSLTSGGSLTPHRLSCCSSTTNPLLDTVGGNKEDVAAAGSLACKSYKELFAMWSANERGQQQEQQ